LFHKLNDKLGTGLAAELVATGIQDHLYPRQLIQVLRAPGPSRHRLAEDGGICH
jgi:hypothetical protein